MPKDTNENVLAEEDSPVRYVEFAHVIADRDSRWPRSSHRYRLPTIVAERETFRVEPGFLHI